MLYFCDNYVLHKVRNHITSRFFIKYLLLTAKFSLRMETWGRILQFLGSLLQQVASSWWRSSSCISGSWICLHSRIPSRQHSAVVWRRPSSHEQFHLVWPGSIKINSRNPDEVDLDQYLECHDPSHDISDCFGTLHGSPFAISILQKWKNVKFL